jgi:hypothetical protein
VTADGGDGRDPPGTGQLDPAVRDVAEQAALGEPLDGRRDGAGTDAERLGQVAGVGDG